MRTLLKKLDIRDAAYLGTLLVTVSGAYFGLATKVDAVAQRVAVIDERVWQLQGRNVVPASLVPESCPADATRVVLR